MYTFEQNAEVTAPKKPFPLVEENSFLSMESEDSPLPKFADVKDASRRTQKATRSYGTWNCLKLTE